MIFKGTDRDAFERASKGLTKKSRSRKYKKYKAQNEKKKKLETSLLYPSKPIFTHKIPKQPIKANVVKVQTSHQKRSAKYIEKRTILDDVRDYRSSKIVSNISNSLAIFIVKCGGRQWDNDTKNWVRSSIALAISEVTNQVLKKPLEIIDNIKLFIKVGKIVYKIIAWIDKATKLWTTDSKSISIVAENNSEYLNYLRKYPCLAKPVLIPNVATNAMKYKVGDIVLLNDKREVLIVKVNNIDRTYLVVNSDEDKNEYTINEGDIVDLLNYD